MTKQTINVGTTANDKQGDSLRAAFQKVNANFTELYTALGLDSGGLNLGAFEFTGSVITTTDSSAITIDQSLSVTGNLSINGELTITARGDSAQPIEQIEPAGWLEITIDGIMSYIPYYR